MLPLPVTWQPLHLINLNLSNCAQQSLSLLIFILSLSENKEGLREGKKGKKIGKKMQKAAWVKIATLIAPILWLWRQNEENSAISSLQELSTDQLKCP